MDFLFTPACAVYDGFHIDDWPPGNCITLMSSEVDSTVAQ